MPQPHPSPWQSTKPTHADATRHLSRQLRTALEDGLVSAPENLVEGGLELVREHNRIFYETLRNGPGPEAGIDPKDVYAASYRTANLLAALNGTSLGPSDHFPYMIATYPEQFGRPDLGSDKPVWDGGKQPGQTLLVHAVKLQGLGDVFQFAPLVNEAKKQGGFEHVAFEVPKRMIPLLEGKGLADELVAKGDPLPAHDLTLPMMSLPSALGVDLHIYRAPDAYLSPSWKIDTPENDWINANIRQRQNKGELVVGLAWQGDAGNFSLEPHRSMNLARLRPLLELENAQFICLQNPNDVPKSPLAEQFAALSDQHRGHLTVLPAGFDRAAMFGDTMHAMNAMDAVISTDTGTAHAAGAAGARLVVMAQHGAELRYPSVRNARLSKAFGDGQCYVRALQYYENATLLQQRRPGDWDSVVRGVRAELMFAAVPTAPAIGVAGLILPTRANPMAGPA